ncbi:ABC-2 type transport system ATP-binding protein [Motilibacter rhizosphaerae]|uniref:ABC-2 type transport system ATP-binding protein n=1 Tax=Motilibacter rhizosphaerae TaxID=598652 RepID=A0A4Q7NP57_9ACTN|nr:ATP-binding cassette domain-containing protein [Motilibacter rhizosphaerae]RZS87041.1 ABC-2 type transport system ATP-binding protein [Motilibacter rhizosphaerae]
MSAPPSAITAESLVKTYPGGKGKEPVRALDGLDLTVAAGSVLGLLGPNGAGKSTAVRILTTLARPDSGRAQVAGHDVARDPVAVRRAVGLVGQRSSSDPLLTGRENLLLAGRIQGMTGRDAGSRTDALLERFGLADAAHRRVRGWSGGMARRLDVAIGLVHRPQVLVVDEPTTGLDPEARAALWQEIRAMRAQERMTVLLTTHYLDEADALADRLALVDAGRVVVEGTPDELKSGLHGDTVTVSLASPAAAMTAAGLLGRVPGLRGVSVDGSSLRARADDGSRALPAVLTALDSGRVEVVALGVARPSLDDVYLHHVGHGLGVAA